MAKELTPREKRCEDCACLVMKNGKMCCDELWGRPCDEIAENDCPEEVTIEEVEENLSKNIKVDHGASGNRKTKTEKVRKVDEVKKELFEIVINALDKKVENGSLKNEVEYSFDYEGERYTFKLTKHRKAKA